MATRLLIDGGEISISADGKGELREALSVLKDERVGTIDATILLRDESSDVSDDEPATVAQPAVDGGTVTEAAGNAQTLADILGIEAEETDEPETTDSPRGGGGGGGGGEGNAEHLKEHRKPKYYGEFVCEYCGEDDFDDSASFGGHVRHCKRGHNMSVGGAGDDSDTEPFWTWTGGSRYDADHFSAGGRERLTSSQREALELAWEAFGSQWFRSSDLHNLFENMNEYTARDPAYPALSELVDSGYLEEKTHRDDQKATEFRCRVSPEALTEDDT